MPKRQKTPPKGWITGKEAAQRLELPLATFYHRVANKKIDVKRYIRTNYSEGFYSEDGITALVLEKDLEKVLHSVEPITFGPVESKNDIRGIVDLCTAIYGKNGTPSLEARLEIWTKNSEVYYVTRQSGVITSYVSLIWFDDEAIASLMGPTQPKTRITSAGKGIYSMTGAEHVQPFVPGQPIDSLFVSIGVRPGLEITSDGKTDQQIPKKHVFRLLRGTQEVLANFVSRGMPVRMLYATSDRDAGKKLAKDLGMKEIEYPGDTMKRYVLDVDESETNSLLLLQYKEALAQYTSN